MSLCGSVPNKTQEICDRIDSFDPFKLYIVMINKKCVIKLLMIFYLH